MNIHLISRKRKIEKLDKAASRSPKKEALQIIDLQGFFINISFDLPVNRFTTDWHGHTTSTATTTR
jgi:hypothetical protein